MTPRFKHDGDILILRTDDNTANAPIEVGGFTLTDNGADEGYVLTSVDADGNGTWEVNAAIELANNAQTAADNAQTAADTAQSTADGANSAAAAAQGTADAAVLDAAAAAATATAAGAAAAVANGLALAAGTDAATAQATADLAITAASDAMAEARAAFPEKIAVFGDELHYVTGTQALSVNTAIPYNWLPLTTTNGADGRITVVLRAGTWAFKLLTVTNNTAGRVTIAVGSTLLADPQELYTAVQNVAAIFTYTSITIPTDGRYEIRFLTNGKNGSSTGFGVVINKFWGYRTGA